MNHWFEYVKCCYDLVIETEKHTNIILRDEVEAYVVHLMARNFNRTDIGKNAIAIQMLEAVNAGEQDKLLSVADECLLIYSYPLRKSKWPSTTYYYDMGTVAYGMANHVMEKHFISSSKVLSAIFNKNTKTNVTV